ncbi:DUF2157 domain-containing protein [Campylobacter suis]|uniref:DUF2157 domain-containing protein n=1 Tax=Campylobacter suis TaxID=2790657 RepID=A0ABM8Q2L3_9BACT|nr:DUF2157 domain-containing protein [Campylobacter suis]CAD7287108.1 hypothetical protein LMG8286_00739 [Campylobacter suis]
MHFFHKNFLAKELIKWQNDGFIDTKTATAIATKYDIDIATNANESNSILRIIAYFFFGCSLLTLVGANWEDIAPDIRTFILIALTTVLNFAGFYNLKNGKDGYGSALLVLASLTFGVSIALIAQIYNLDKNLSNGVLLWAVGTFIVALGSQKSLVMGVGLIASAIWILSSLMQTGVSINFYLIFLLGGIWLALKDSSRLLVFGIFISLSCYIFGNYEAFEIFMYASIFSTLSYTLLMFSLSHFLSKFAQHENASYLSTIAGYSFFTLMLFYFTFASFAENIEFYLNFNEIFSQLNNNFGDMFVIFSLASLGVGFYFRDKILIAVSIFVVLLPFLLAYINATILLSVFIVGAGILLIKNDFVFKGVGLIFYVAIVQYMRLIGDYIGTSLLFLAFAISILIITKTRRKHEKI